MTDHHIIWWNVENLFDVKDAPYRSNKLKRTLANELKDWEEPVLDKKLEQLSTIIEKMNGNKGPDILGVCEIENEQVLDKLVSNIDLTDREYGVAHEDTRDRRGIDVAFIYDTEKYEKEGIFSHFIVKRNATRDILQVDFKIKSTDREIVVIGNHWPARRGGELSSEPYRIMAAENMAYFIERITEIKGHDIPIVVMGDFNDEPFDRSIKDYARSTRELARVQEARSMRLYNLMWKEMGLGKASYYYNKFPNMIDQFMISQSITTGDNHFSVNIDSIKILDWDELKNDDGFPKRFGRPTSTEFNDPNYDPGFSDHFPLEMKLIEE